MTNKKTAIILFNLGGPDSLGSVEKFLFNLFCDKAIINLPQPFRFLLAKLISKKRVAKAQKIYSQIGGKSPLLDITNSQAHSLEMELSFVGNFKTFVVMRYFAPRAKDVIKKIKEYNPDKIILLPLYPQFSSATTNSSLNEFIEEISGTSLENLPLKIVCCYPAQADFIRSHALLIKQSLMKIYDKNIADFRFLFSAHGLPQKLIDQGDPYVFQITKTTKEVVKILAEILSIKEQEIDFEVCYQSKVGPLQWTSPSLDVELRRAVLDKKIPVIVPISFVSDHSETLVELDIDYKNLATELGAKNYLRVASLNIEGNFIKSLVEICKAVNEGEESNFFSGCKKNRICSKEFKFCPNQNSCEV